MPPVQAGIVPSALPARMAPIGVSDLPRSATVCAFACNVEIAVETARIVAARSSFFMGCPIPSGRCLTMQRRSLI